MTSTLRPPKTGYEDPAMEKLRALLVSLKKKYGEALAQLHNRESGEKEREEELLRLRESSRLLSQKFHETLVELTDLRKEHARQKSDQKEQASDHTSYQEELSALKAQFSSLMDDLEAAKEEAKRAHDELQAVKLKETQLERVIQFLRKRSEEVHLESNQITQEYTVLQDAVHKLEQEIKNKTDRAAHLESELLQKNSLIKVQCEELQALGEQLVSLRTLFTEEEGIKNELSKELTITLSHLEQKEKQLSQLSKEHSLLKELTMTSLQEMKHQQAEKENLFAKELDERNKQHELDLREKIGEIDRLQEELAERKSRLAALESTLEQLQPFLEEKGTLENAIVQKNDLLLQREEENKEIEQKFRSAQHHLAKKVRESSALAKKVEEQDALLQSQRGELYSLKESLQSAKEGLASALEGQLRASEKESELKRLYEEQIGRVESKYIDAYERLQRKEQELKELRTIEERFRQMELFFLKPAPLMHDRPEALSPSKEPATKKKEESWMDQPSFL